MKVMKRVVCIDAGNIFLCGMIPLIEGKTYTVRAETIQPRGAGYLLNEIHNPTNLIKNKPGLEPCYLQTRFISVEERDRQVAEILMEIEKLGTND